MAVYLKINKIWKVITLCRRQFLEAKIILISELNIFILYNLDDVFQFISLLLQWYNQCSIVYNNVTYENY